jgi:serine acetyltransferase
MAAGSVVRGEVPDHSVVAGVPARVVRSRTPAGWAPAAMESALAAHKDTRNAHN